MHTSLLATSLRLCGRRRIAVTLTSGTGWAVVALLGVLLLGAWFDLLWELPAVLRLAWGLLAIVACVVVLGRAGLLARRGARPGAVARRLDAVAGSGGEILTGTDLLQQETASASLSDGLAALAVDRAGQLAGKVARERAIPARPIGWSLAALGLLCVIVGAAAWWVPRLVMTQWSRFVDPFGDHPPFSRVLFHVEPGDVQVTYGAGIDIRVQAEGATIDRLTLVWKPEDAAAEETLPLFLDADGTWRVAVAHVTSSGHYFVRSHEGRSKRFTVTVLTVPRLENVRFRVTPPAYTNRPAYEGPLPQGGLAGLAGTRVQVTARSNRPLAGGSLEVLTEDGKSTALDMIADGSEASGSFEIRKAGKLHFKVRDTAGQWSTDPFTAPITLLTDERPSIRIVEPPPVSLATPAVSLPMVISAEDDYGITRIELYRSLNDSRPLPVEVPIPQPPPTRWNATVQLPLAEYGLEPGDEIKLFARVEDNDPAGAKGSESRVVVVRIIAQSDFERLVRARQGMQMLLSRYQQAQRRLENLKDDADRLQKKVKDNPNEGARKAREEMAELARKMRRDAEALQRLARNPLDYDLDRQLAEHLERLSRRLEEAAREAERLAKDDTLSRKDLAEALKKLGEQLDREQQLVQQEAVDPLEHLSRLMPLIEDSKRFSTLAERQRALAERLKALKDREKVDDPKEKARLRDLQAEQEEIRKDLAKLLDDLEDHMDRLPEDKELDELRKSVAEFVEKVRRSGATEAMTEAESGMAAQSGKRGHTGADKAADILEGLCDQCQGENGMSGKAKMAMKFKPSLRDGLGQTIDQLLRDAGLMPGQGQGNGGGTSARRNTLDNVGLYGQVPGLEDVTQNPSSKPGGKMGTGQTTKADGGTDRGQRPGASGTTPPAGTAGAEAAVPPSYRRRVADYFQRVADETGGK